MPMKKLYRLLLLLLAIAPILTVNCSELHFQSAYLTRLSTMGAAGMMPDVGFIDALWASEQIGGGLAQPLPGDLDLGDFDPQLLAYFQRGGQTYALPHDAQTLALVVNAELLAKAGFDFAGIQEQAGKGQWTWDDLEAVAAALTEKLGPGIYGVGLTPGFWNFVPFLFQAGGSLLNESGTAMALNTPAGEEALGFYVGLYEKGYVFVPGGEWPYWGAYGEMLDAFAQDRVGMFMASPSMYDDLLERMGLDPATQEKVRAIELPAGRAGIQATVGQVRGFCLFTEPSAASMAFLEYITGREAARFWIGDRQSPSDYVPARRSLRDAWIKAHPDTVAAFATSVDDMRFYPEFTMYAGTIARFDQEASARIDGIFRGRMAVGDALAEIEQVGNELLAEKP